MQHVKHFLAQHVNHVTCCVYATSMTSTCLCETLLDCDHIVLCKVEIGTYYDRSMSWLPACRSRPERSIMWSHILLRKTTGVHKKHGLLQSGHKSSCIRSIYKTKLIKIAFSTLNGTICRNLWLLEIPNIVSKTHCIWPSASCPMLMSHYLSICWASRYNV